MYHLGELLANVGNLRQIPVALHGIKALWTCHEPISICRETVGLCLNPASVMQCATGLDSHAMPSTVPSWSCSLAQPNPRPPLQCPPPPEHCVSFTDPWIDPPCCCNECDSGFVPACPLTSNGTLNDTCNEDDLCGCKCPTNGEPALPHVPLALPV